MAIRFNGITPQQATEMEQPVGMVMDVLRVDSFEIHVRTIPITRIKLQRVSESQSTFPQAAEVVDDDDDEKEEL